jgi:hypothetical protein
LNAEALKEEINGIIFNLNRAKLMIEQKNNENLEKFLENALKRFKKVIKNLED